LAAIAQLIERATAFRDLRSRWCRARRSST